MGICQKVNGNLKIMDAAATGHQVCPPCRATLPGPARDPSPMDEAASPARPPRPGQVPDANVQEVRIPAAPVTCYCPANHFPDRMYLSLTNGGGTCRRDAGRSLKNGPSSVRGAVLTSFLPKETVGAVRRANTLHRAFPLAMIFWSPFCSATRTTCHA
jgi:hypothetical protein